MMNGYKTSTDYERLWELVMQGYSIAAWVWRTSEHTSSIAECKKRQDMVGYFVSIGSRGISYGTCLNKKEFILTCATYELKYIEPNSLNSESS